MGSVRDLADGASQNLSTPRLWQPFHEDNSNKASKSTNINSNFRINFRLKSLLLLGRHVLGALALQDDKGQWALSSDLLIEANDGTLDDF